MLLDQRIACRRRGIGRRAFCIFHWREHLRRVTLHYDGSFRQRQQVENKSLEFDRIRGGRLHDVTVVIDEWH